MRRRRGRPPRAPLADVTLAPRPALGTAARGVRSRPARPRSLRLVRAARTSVRRRCSSRRARRRWCRYVPAELSRPPSVVAVFPALALGSFTILVTTLSTLGVPLTELSIRAGGGRASSSSVRRSAVDRAGGRGDTAGCSAGARLAGVAAVLVLARVLVRVVVGHRRPVPAARDGLGPLLPLRGRGRAAGGPADRGSLLGARRDSSSRTPPMVGALYGSVRMLDGVSSARSEPAWRSPRPSPTMSVVAAAGGLWGLGGGLAAGALYAVAPIRLDPDVLARARRRRSRSSSSPSSCSRSA